MLCAVVDVGAADLSCDAHPAPMSNNVVTHAVPFTALLHRSEARGSTVPKFLDREPVDKYIAAVRALRAWPRVGMASKATDQGHRDDSLRIPRGVRRTRLFYDAAILRDVSSRARAQQPPGR